MMNWSYISKPNLTSNLNDFNTDNFNPNVFNPNLTNNLKKLSRTPNQELAQKISSMTNSQNLKSLLHSHGLDIKNVTWEDTARNKNSAWGPNISDMTLRAEQTNMPVIRRPNFADVTVDHSIGNFNVTVGNESGTQLNRIKFTDYLEQIQTYTSNPNISKLFESGEEVLCSTQVCLLPATNSEVNFNVRLFNYQSSSTNPAVLVIVASNQGTSSMVLDSKTTDILFNSSGRAFDFVAERLREERKRLGKDLDTPMTGEEKERNVLFIYQIPLKQKEIYKSSNIILQSYDTDSFIVNESYGVAKSKGFKNSGTVNGDVKQSIMNLGYGISFNGSNNLKSVLDDSTSTDNELETSLDNNTNKYGLDNAMLRVSDKDKGVFEGTKGLKLERDFRYPIRCTLQYYWITGSEEISQEQIGQIASQLETFYTNSSNKSSLVYGQTNRKTEPKTNIIKENPAFTDYLSKYY